MTSSYDYFAVGTKKRVFCYMKIQQSAKMEAGSFRLFDSRIGVVKKLFTLFGVN